MKLLNAALSLLTLLSLAVPSRGSATRYTPHKLFELAAGADLVVAGTIRDVRLGAPRPWTPSSPPGTFRLEIETVIVGTPPPDALQVACFEDWACAKRGTSYAPGQRVLLFLAAPAPDSTSYRILSGGGEGEMPLLGDLVVARGYRIEGHDGFRELNGEAAWPKVEGVEVIERSSPSSSSAKPCVGSARPMPGRTSPARTCRARFDPDIR